MSRSIKKGPFIAKDLIRKLGSSSNHKIIKTRSRSSVIFPLMIGKTIAVYDGRKYVPLYIMEEMLDHKLGEFVPTRTFKSHAGAQKTNKGG